MADNIFDAQRGRRIQNLQQQSVSNIIKQNPNLRSVLTRYEDAEVSRIKLLELQQLRNKKITAGEKALLKAVAKSRGRRRGRQPKEKKTKPAEPAEPVKSQTQIEVEAEEKRAKIKQEEKRLRQQDRFLELEDFRQQREFVANERRLEQRELQRLTDFATGQNRLIADAQIAQFNQAQENIRANQRGIQRAQDRQLEEDRLDLQRREIQNQFETNREQRALEYARIDNDRDRYNADVRRAEAERDQQAIRADAEIQSVRERVAADNARQHAEFQETQRLALEQLAQQQRDNTARHQLEQNRIDNQRAVDAERAITDRELIQTLQSSLDALNRFQAPQELPEGTGRVEPVDEPQRSPASPESTSSSSLGVPPNAREIARRGQQVVRDAEDDLRLEAESNSISSEDPENLFRVPPTDPEIQRAVAIQSGRRASPTPRIGGGGGQEPRRFERRAEGDPTVEGEPTPGTLREVRDTPDRLGSYASDEVVANRLRGQRRVAPPTAPEPEGSLSGSTEEEFQRILEGSPEAGLEPEQQGIAARAVQTGVGGLATVGQAAGGLIGGVVQGVGEQLPAASDVGASVGTAGVRAVSGIGSAVYQGLRGSPRPGEQTGGRLDPEGQVVGLGREIEEGTPQTPQP